MNNFKCCKCDNKSVGYVLIEQKKYLVCLDHVPEGHQLYQHNIEDQLKSNNFIIVLNNKNYVLYSGLLWLAHQHGLKSIQTELIEHNRQERFAVFKATVTGTRGVFVGYGDACPKTCTKKTADAYIRISETRAIARSLRSFCGCGMTSLEELPGKEEQPKRNKKSAKILPDVTDVSNLP